MYLDKQNEEELLSELHVNFLNINRSYLSIPEQSSTQSENETLITEKVSEYTDNLLISKKIIEMLLEKASCYV